MSEPPNVPPFEPTPPPPEFEPPPKRWWSPGQPWRDQRWGAPDIVLAIPVLMVASGLGLALTAVVPDDGFDTVLGLAVGALVWLAVPIAAVKLRGSGSLADDLGFRITLGDVGLGVAGFFAAMISTATFVLITMALTGQEEQVSNTGFIGEVNDRPLVAIGVAFFVALVIPIGEELFFRGLVLRAITKRSNIVAGSIVSWIVFGLGHFQPGTWTEVVTLYAGIFGLAIVLTGLTLLTGRLGASIVTHILINSAATAVALFGAPDLASSVLPFG